MSKVSYLWGAGASYGKRSESGSILRGVPIINELEKACVDLLGMLKKSSGISQKHSLAMEKFRCNIIKLQEVCDLYPTIDTYAKQLYVNDNAEITFDVDVMGENNYEKFKRLLTLFFMVVQHQYKRDPRYDGFLASVLDNNGVFPPLTILTWNYDLQFELAYKGYISKKNPTLEDDIWRALNVYSKTHHAKYDTLLNYAVIKLNGTATFVNNPIFNVREKGDLLELNFLPRIDLSSFVQSISNFSQYESKLSYAWEKEGESQSILLEQVKRRVNDTEELVVIGYSFPYVNREVDEYVLCSIADLKRVVIQDPNAMRIKTRIESLLRSRHMSLCSIEIECITDVDEFYLPRSFV